MSKHRAHGGILPPFPAAHGAYAEADWPRRTVRHLTGRYHRPGRIRAFLAGFCMGGVLVALIVWVR